MKSSSLAISIICIAILSGCSLSKLSKPANSTTSRQTNAAPGLIERESPSGNTGHPDNSATGTPSQSTEVKDDLHTPEKGSSERQAIMDALRGNQNVVFQVNYLKVHNGWAWVDTTPLDSKGRATAEGGANLLHFENGTWRIMNLSKVPEDPDDPMGPDDPSPTYIRNLMKTFPRLPKDILPTPSN